MKESPLKPPIATDNELLMRFVLRKDQQAFRELVERHAGMVMAVCRQITSQQQDAEDAFQTAFVILAERGHRMLRNVSVSGWLYRVAYRASLRAVRRRRRRQEETLPIDIGAAHAQNPLERIQSDEIQRILHEEVQRLPIRYRDVIVLCDLQEHSRAQAAEQLDVTEQSVKASLARARRLLRMQLLRRGVAMSVAVILTRSTLAASKHSPLLTNQTVEIVTNGRSSSPSGYPDSILRQTWSMDMIFSSPDRTLAVLVVTAMLCLIPAMLLTNANGDSPQERTTTVDLRANDTPVDREASVEVNVAQPIEERPAMVGGFGPSSPSVQALDGGDYVLVQKGFRTFLSYSKSEGKWDQYTFPASVSAVAIVNEPHSLERNAKACAIFQLSGPAISELVAVDSNGAFRTHQLANPVDGQHIAAVATGQLAFCHIGATLYAFSGKTGTWDSLDAPHLGIPPDTHYERLRTDVRDTFLVDCDDRFAAFSLHAGKWSTQVLAEPAALPKEIEGTNPPTASGP
jgi:RNA polymerase sigma factor (sigma-70 family)